jgi:iron complex outermembrane receptor protein
VEVAAGSYGRRSLEGLAGKRLSNGLGVMLGGLWDHTRGQDLYYREYDAPTTNSGVARDLDGERRAAVLGSLSWGDFRLHGRYGGRRKEIPTGAYEMVFDAPGPYTWDAYSFLELNYTRELSARIHLAARTYYTDYYYAGCSWTSRRR